MDAVLRADERPSRQAMGKQWAAKRAGTREKVGDRNMSRYEVMPRMQVCPTESHVRWRWVAPPVTPRTPGCATLHVATRPKSVQRDLIYTRCEWVLQQDPLGLNA